MFLERLLRLGLEFLENNFLEGRLLDQFFSLGLELLKNSSLEVFWSDFRNRTFFTTQFKPYRFLRLVKCCFCDRGLRN